MFFFPPIIPFKKYFPFHVELCDNCQKQGMFSQKAIEYICVAIFLDYLNSFVHLCISFILPVLQFLNFCFFITFWIRQILQFCFNFSYLLWQLYFHISCNRPLLNLTPNTFWIHIEFTCIYWPFGKIEILIFQPWILCLIYLCF